MKKAVLQLGVNDDKEKKKAMKIVSGLSGVDSISMDMKDKKLTVIGVMDPVTMVSKLRKLCPTEIVSVGAAKESEKKKEDDKKKEEAKKDDKKKGEPKKDDVAELVKAYEAHNPYRYFPPYYYVTSVEEDPNTCVLC